MTDVAGERPAETVRFSVPELDCASCATTVTEHVDSLNGIDTVEPNVAAGRVSVTYRADSTSPDAIADRITAAGYDAIRTDVRSETLDVPDLDCSSCAGVVESALSKTAGVVEANPDPATGRVTVTYETDRTNQGVVVDAVENAGYDVVDVDSGDAAASATVWTSRRAITTWVAAGFLALALFLTFLLPSRNVVLGRGIDTAAVFFFTATALSGLPVVQSGYRSLRARNIDIQLLMSAGILAALTVGLYLEAATLAVLFSVAELLERYSMDRARNSLRELVDLAADTATVKHDGEEQTVPVEQVQPGDLLVVRPGEKIPADGVVRDGGSAVNEAPITGESVPVDKTPGDEVYAGTINEDGYVEVEATAAASDSTLARIVELVADASREKTEREQFVDRFASYYTPVVVAAAILVAAVPPLAFGMPWRTWFVRGLTLLVISCPCAFVISTPVSVVSGVTSAARNGVLVKGGSHLEAMADVDVVAFDKTGTLTTGDLAVTDVVPLNGTSGDDLLRCAGSLEARSEHPIANAIVDHADEQAVGDRDVDDFENLPGKGVRADLDGTTHYAGKPGLFEDLGFDLEHVHLATDGGVATCEQDACHNLLEETIPDLQREGKTIVLVGTEDELEGAIAIADTVRPDAAATVANLHERGVDRIVMLTGDNERTARVIARDVGVDDYQAGLLPEDKVAAVDDLTNENDVVAMVGDGVNDAPALATATVGVAMGAAGTDTALETADVALMGDDLSRLPYLHDLSTEANTVIRQSIWTSLAVKALLAAGIPFGYVNVVIAILVGDMGMSLGVTGNAMRLAGVTPDE